MLKLGTVQGQERKPISPDAIYGTVREVLAQWQADNQVKDAILTPEFKSSLKADGKAMPFVFREVNDRKKPENLLKSERIMLSKQVSDEVRKGKCALSALLDFTIVHHTVSDEFAGAGNEYPLMVRETAPIDNAWQEDFGVRAEDTVTITYQRDDVDITSVLSIMQL